MYVTPPCTYTYIYMQLYIARGNQACAEMMCRTMTDSMCKPSLVLRLSYEREPGNHCMCMRQIYRKTFRDTFVMYDKIYGKGDTDQVSETRAYEWQLSCRICSSVVERSHCVSLFSQEMTKCNLASRMSRLLEVPISQEDPLAHCACRSCKGKFISMESKLESLWTLANSNFQSLASSCPEQETWYWRITAKTRPASKRGVGRSRTFFPSESCKRILDQNYFYWYNNIVM